MLGGKLAPGVWEGRARVQPFPPSRAAAGIAFSADPNLLAGVWWGEASATPCSWQVHSPLGSASGCANKPLFPVNRQHQPPLCLPPLQSCREEKGSLVYLTLLCPLEML